LAWGEPSSRHADRASVTSGPVGAFSAAAGRRYASAADISTGSPSHRSVWTCKDVGTRGPADDIPMSYTLSGEEVVSGERPRPVIDGASARIPSCVCIPLSRHSYTISYPTPPMPPPPSPTPTRVPRLLGRCTLRMQSGWSFSAASTLGPCCHSHCTLDGEQWPSQATLTSAPCHRLCLWGTRPATPGGGQKP
jgi:hypothetical protein